MLSKIEILRTNSNLVDDVIFSNANKQKKEIAEILSEQPIVKKELGDRKITEYDLREYFNNVFFKNHKDLDSSIISLLIKRYNWRGKNKFIIGLIKKYPGASYEKYAECINDEFKDEILKVTADQVRDYITRRIYTKHPKLKELRIKKRKLSLGLYVFKGKEKEILEILKSNLSLKWEELADKVNKKFPTEPVKLTADKLKDYCHINIFSENLNLKKQRKKKNRERLGYVWTEEKRKYLLSILREYPTLIYSGIVKKMNSNFKEGRKLDKRALAFYLSNHIYREEIESNGQIVKLNRKLLKRQIQWKGEIHDFLKNLLKVNENSRTQKVNNFNEILDILKDEFPEYEPNFTGYKLREYIHRKFPEHIDRLRLQFELTEEYIEFWFNVVGVNPNITAKSLLEKTKKKFSNPYCQKPPALCTIEQYLKGIKESISIPNTLKEKRDILESVSREKKSKKRTAKSRLYSACLR